MSHMSERDAELREAGEDEEANPDEEQPRLIETSIGYLDHGYVFIVPTVENYPFHDTFLSRSPRGMRDVGYHAFYSDDKSRCVVVTRSAYLLRRKYATYCGRAVYRPNAPRDSNLRALLTAGQAK